MDGRAGSAGVAAQVQQGYAVVGFMVSAVPAHLIMQVADADLILPAKVRFYDFCELMIKQAVCVSNLLYLRDVVLFLMVISSIYVFVRQHFLTQSLWAIYFCDSFGEKKDRRIAYVLQENK